MTPQRSLTGRRILLCVTGGIAAYKIADLASKLIQTKAEVRVAQTFAAQKFITPLTFQALTGQEVATSLWEAAGEKFSTRHIALTDWAELTLVAPATANILGKLAGGISDDLVSTLLLAAKPPILLAPAMNVRMWANPIVQENIEKLKRLGYALIGPATGRLACGTVGPGRMAEPDDLLDQIHQHLPPK